MRRFARGGVVAFTLLGCRGEEAKPTPVAPRDAALAPPVDAAGPDAFVIKPAAPVTLSCPAGATQVEGTYTESFGSTLLTEVVCEASGRRNGPYKRFDDDGALAEEGTFVDDKLDGMWVRYRADGTKREVGAYVKDRMTGTWTTYHSNGKVNCKSLRENDQTVERTCFDERGRVVVRGKSPGGRDDGMWDWFEDGKPVGSILYKDGTATKWWLYPGGKRTAVSEEAYDADVSKPETKKP